MTVAAMEATGDDQVLTPFSDDELREVAQILGSGQEDGSVQDLVLSSEVIGEKNKALEKEVQDVEREVLDECL